MAQLLFCRHPPTQQPLDRAFGESGKTPGLRGMGAANIDDPYYRIVPLGAEDPANTANRRPYRRLSDDPSQDPRGHRQGNQGVEIEAPACQVEQLICALEKIVLDMDKQGREGDLSAARPPISRCRSERLWRAMIATMAPAQTRLACAIPPPDISIIPPFAQGHLNARVFCRSPILLRYAAIHQNSRSS